MNRVYSPVVKDKPTKYSTECDNQIINLRSCTLTRHSQKNPEQKYIREERQDHRSFNYPIHSTKHQGESLKKNKKGHLDVQCKFSPTTEPIPLNEIEQDYILLEEGRIQRSKDPFNSPKTLRITGEFIRIICSRLENIQCHLTRIKFATNINH